MIEINNKLQDSLYLKDKNYDDLVLYNKEIINKNDGYSSTISSNNSSIKSLNKSFSSNSIIIQNKEDNKKLNDKFTPNNINKKLDNIKEKN